MQNLDPLFHLELKHRRVLVVHVILLGLLRRGRTYELHECLARLGDVGGDLESLLCLGHEIGLGTRLRDELSGRTSHLAVRRDNVLLV